MEILIQNVSQSFGSKRALSDVTWRMTPGVWGLLGPNGAGKSTLMRTMATIAKPTEGNVYFNGVDVFKRPNVLRQTLGYLPQSFGVYPHLNAVEFLQYIAAIKGLNGREVKRRIDELIDLLNLREASKRPIGSYSGGMRQRVGIAQALLNDPQVLIFDEPTVGLDPGERIRFRNLLSSLAGERIVILSTHIVSDIQSTANNIAILSAGRMRTIDRLENILHCVHNRVWHWVVKSEDLTRVQQAYVVSEAVRKADGIHVKVVAEQSPHPSARTTSPTLEEAYLYQITAVKEFEPYV